MKFRSENSSSIVAAVVIMSFIGILIITALHFHAINHNKLLITSDHEESHGTFFHSHGECLVANIMGSDKDLNNKQQDHLTADFCLILGKSNQSALIHNDQFPDHSRAPPAS